MTSGKRLAWVIVSLTSLGMLGAFPVLGAVARSVQASRAFHRYILSHLHAGRPWAVGAGNAIGTLQRLSEKRQLLNGLGGAGLPPHAGVPAASAHPRSATTTTSRAGRRSGPRPKRAGGHGVIPASKGRRHPLPGQTGDRARGCAVPPHPPWPAF